jgi:hypothetical protein
MPEDRQLSAFGIRPLPRIPCTAADTLCGLAARAALLPGIRRYRSSDISAQSDFAGGFFIRSFYACACTTTSPSEASVAIGWRPKTGPGTCDRDPACPDTRRTTALISAGRSARVKAASRIRKVCRSERRRVPGLLAKDRNRNKDCSRRMPDSSCSRDNSRRRNTDHNSHRRR